VRFRSEKNLIGLKMKTMVQFCILEDGFEFQADRTPDWAPTAFRGPNTTSQRHTATHHTHSHTHRHTRVHVVLRVVVVIRAYRLQFVSRHAHTHRLFFESVVTRRISIGQHTTAPWPQHAPLRQQPTPNTHTARDRETWPHTPRNSAHV
jgi:hypothetical protein